MSDGARLLHLYLVVLVKSLCRLDQGVGIATPWLDRGFTIAAKVSRNRSWYLTLPGRKVDEEVDVQMNK